jgi:DeoR family transcriptional regulator, glycerol-3-phosphate regulon repressor
MAGLSHRQTEILNIARASGRVLVEDLARRFEVSAQTIRKDLNDLCEQRALTRIHGGAMIASGVENLAYEARRFVAAEEKKAIGAAAAALIPNGCSLFINIGTTTEEVASALTGHEDLLVITNNLNVAMLLYRYPRIEVVVAGGAVRRADGAVVGSTATQLIGQFKVDYAIIGVSAIDEEGALLDFDYREVQVAQAIIANARSVMLGAGAHRAYEPDQHLRHRLRAARRARQHLPFAGHRGDRGATEGRWRDGRGRAAGAGQRSHPDSQGLIPSNSCLSIFVMSCLGSARASTPFFPANPWTRMAGQARP